jgi:hypothetical protein
MALDSQLQSDKVYQLLAYGRWFSPGTSASSTTKTAHYDNIAESGIKHQKSINQSILCPDNPIPSFPIEGASWRCAEQFCGLSPSDGLK